MLTNVDYLSISFPETIGTAHETGDDAVFASAFRHVLRKSYELYGLFAQNEAEFGRGQKPFSHSLGFKGFTYYWHPKMANSLLQISGQGCAELRKLGLLDEIITTYFRQLTRFDVASDIKTDISPFEFLPEAEIPARISSRDKIETKTGKTFYVGSLKGAEYTRIYRYNHPHPRADLLRVETVYRHDNAKDAASIYLQAGFSPLVVRTKNRLNITHPLYEFDPDAPRAQFYRADTGQANTLRWLQTSVRSAFKRLVQDGTIENPAQFLADTFLH